MLENEIKEQDPSVIDPPPFFDTWNKMYALVMGMLAFYVYILYLFTEYYS